MTKDIGLALAVPQRLATLIQDIRRQSQPRRWPWQEKTVRDLLDERRTDLAEVAVSRSAQLAAAAAELRDTVLGEFERQSKPRRFFWQERTAYDKVTAQRERIANTALERANALVEEATILRDTLLAEARRQSQPRRFFWQEKTLRDKLEDQKVALVKQTQPRRFFWQEETLRDRFDERREELRGRFDQRQDQVRGTIADTLPTIQESAAAAAERVREGAKTTADLVQNQISLAPQRLTEAAEGLRETADQAKERVRESADLAAQRVWERAEQATETAKAVALAPVEVVRSGVESGQEAITGTVKAGRRSVRRGVRLGRVFLWALLIGTIIGVLLAPRPGEETRRNLAALWNRIQDIVAPSS